ncbi:MAG: O-antigen ligase family protein [Patescibacteria group bacterium]|nr:O-antigen ligase family protein [Patescibacteria group bacterium]
MNFGKLFSKFDIRHSAKRIFSEADIQRSGYSIFDVWAFLLPIFLPLYVIRFNIGPLPTTALEVFVLVSFAIWLVSKTQDFASLQNNAALRRWVWPITAWLVATLIAALVAQDKWGAFGHWRAFMLEPILIFVMLTNLIPPAPLNKRGTKQWLMYGISAVTIMLGLYAIVQFATGWGIPHPWDAWPGRRATGVFGFPNGLSLFVVPFGVVCWMELLKIKNYELRIKNFGVNFYSILFLSATIAAGTAVVLAKSMGGIIAFGIGIVLTLIINKKTRRVGAALSALGLIVAAIVGYQILSTQLNSTNIDATIFSTKRWSSMVRTVIWQESIQIIKVHPLLGTGLRSYQTAIAPYHTATWMEIFPHPHNIILMVWIETGLLGLLAFIWICVAWVKMVQRPRYVVLAYKQLSNQDHGPGTMDPPRWLWVIPLIVILVHGMIDMPYFKNDLAMQFWILAALATI